MRPTHNGVLLPDEMLTASDADKDEYAALVKAGNRAFCDAYHTLQERARELGVTLAD